MNDLVPILAGGALTVVGGAGAEALRDRRAWSRAKRDRAATREERREDFQREAMIELQDALQRYARAIGAVTHFDEMTQRKHGQQFQVPDEMSDDIYAAQVLTQKLASRIVDEEIRTWVEGVITEGSAAVWPNAEEPFAHRMAMGDFTNKAHQKLGALIREL